MKMLRRDSFLEHWSLNERKHKQRGKWRFNFLVDSVLNLDSNLKKPTASHRILLNSVNLKRLYFSSLADGQAEMKNDFQVCRFTRSISGN